MRRFASFWILALFATAAIGCSSSTDSEPGGNAGGSAGASGAAGAAGTAGAAGATGGAAGATGGAAGTTGGAAGATGGAAGTTGGAAGSGGVAGATGGAAGSTGGAAAATGGAAGATGGAAGSTGGAAGATGGAAGTTGGAAGATGGAAGSGGVAGTGGAAGTGGTTTPEGGTSSDGGYVSTATIPATFPASYTGTPYSQPNAIPGKVECEYFDVGTEGVAWHDTTGGNSGDFKRADATNVDTSVTKGGWDDSPYNMVPQQIGAQYHYIGWIDTGEWWNYTVNIAEAGTYSVNVMYTWNGDQVLNGGSGQAALSIAFNGVDAGAPLNLISTYSPLETNKDRNWHHWNKINGILTITLPAGKTLVTLKAASGGSMNLDYLEFVKK